MLTEKLKAINFQIDQCVKEHLLQKQQTARHKVTLAEEREAYWQSMDNQLKVNEKLIEQYVLEKAKIQMRVEQLEDPALVQQMKDDIERAQQEISNVRTMNYRLQVEQGQNIEQLNRFADTYKSDENQALRHIKSLKEDLQRVTLQIVEKERAIEGMQEKFKTYSDKID